MNFYWVVLEKHAPFREGRDGKKIIHSQSTAQFTMNSLFSNIFLLIFSNKQRVNHQYYSQTSAGSHPTSWPCWSLRMCSLTFILQLYKSCTMTVGATHAKSPTFLQRTQQLTCLMMCAVQCWISTLDAMIFQVQVLMKLIHSLPCSAPHQYMVRGEGHSGVHTGHTYPSGDYRFCPHCGHPLQGRPRLWGFQFHKISILSPAVIVNSSR